MTNDKKIPLNKLRSTSAQKCFTIRWNWRYREENWSMDREKQRNQTGRITESRLEIWEVTPKEGAYSSCTRFFPDSHSWCFSFRRWPSGCFLLRPTTDFILEVIHVTIRWYRGQKKSKNARYRSKFDRLQRWLMQILIGGSICRYCGRLRFFSIVR